MLPWSPTGNQVFESVWMTVLSFQALLFTISIAFILLAMAKERTEHRHKTAALIDPLTGIANRRAFLQNGEAQLKRQATDPRPIAVMPLDLDNFKSINDRFGHAIGDRVLEIFAEEASGCMRRMDFFGRLGGEEFAALLLDTTRERAMAVGEDIRARFAAATRDVEGRPVAATVSVGVVISHDAVLDLSALLAQADHALYRAKDSGRNRVEIASIELILDRAKCGAADLVAAGSPAATPAAKNRRLIPPLRRSLPSGAHGHFRPGSIRPALNIRRHGLYSSARITVARPVPAGSPRRTACRRSGCSLSAEGLQVHRGDSALRADVQSAAGRDRDGGGTGTRARATHAGADGS